MLGAGAFFVGLLALARERAWAGDLVAAGSFAAFFAFVAFASVVLAAADFPLPGFFAPERRPSLTGRIDIAVVRERPFFLSAMGAS